MIIFENITVCFEKETVLDRFSHSFPKGSKTVLVGASGIGKTTLLRVAAGLLKSTEGQCIHEGNSAIMFQEPRLLPWCTAGENVRAVLKKSYENSALANEMLAAVGLSEAADKYPSELSGGMAQRISFARFLAYAKATDADLLLLDEPFSALDPETADKMLSLLQKNAESKTLLMVSHDPTVAEKLKAEILTI